MHSQRRYLGKCPELLPERNIQMCEFFGKLKLANRMVLLNGLDTNLTVVYMIISAPVTQKIFNIFARRAVIPRLQPPPSVWLNLPIPLK